MSDYIKREDAIKWLTNLKEDCGRYQDLWPYGEALEQIIESLDVDTAPVRHGKWEREEEYGDLWICNQCGFAGEYKDNYCPNCGAKMEGDENETD